MSYFHDHFGYANGDVRLYKGSTCLLCPSAYRSAMGGNFDGEGITPDFSTYMVNGKAQANANRNNQILYTLENGSWSAIGMRFESSYANGNYDEGYIDTGNPLDYLIREAVHLRPDTLVVRDLSRRRHSTDTLVARWHLGSSAARTNETNGFSSGGLHVASFGATQTFANDVDGSGNTIGTLMTETLPSSTSQTETVHVFSASQTAVSYTAGVLKLSGGQCVSFANGTVTVATCH